MTDTSKKPSDQAMAAAVDVIGACRLGNPPRALVARIIDDHTYFPELEAVVCSVAKYLTAFAGGETNAEDAEKCLMELAQKMMLLSASGVKFHPSTAMSIVLLATPKKGSREEEMENFRAIREKLKHPNDRNV